MRKIKVYEYERCSTCRKALGFVDQRKVPYEAELVKRPFVLGDDMGMVGFDSNKWPTEWKKLFK